MIKTNKIDHQTGLPIYELELMSRAENEAGVIYYGVPTIDSSIRSVESSELKQ